MILTYHCLTNVDLEPRSVLSDSQATKVIIPQTSEAYGVLAVLSATRKRYHPISCAATLSLVVPGLCPWLLSLVQSFRNDPSKPCLESEGWTQKLGTNSFKCQLAPKVGAQFIDFDWPQISWGPIHL